ncbi:hypothetical protein SK128_024016 [Halocaridina rubra]|uniref:Ion transport domain-containing protein n=1 Tax=Halocaridina rubra TaxID=373956 RepID=A0AAN9A384_HALRR
MHFNNFLWATVTVFQVCSGFQILTQEDWNVVLFNGMEKTNHWASLYFVALMTFGNYVLFNLLVAILVEGFSAERNERLEKEQKELEKRKRKDEEETAQSTHDNQSDGENPGGDSRTDDKEASSSKDVMELTKIPASHSRTTIDLCKESPSELLSPDSAVEGVQIPEDDKKRSASTLEAPEDERRHLKGNEERIKENQLRQKLLYAEPKCNIEKGECGSKRGCKESKLLQMPQIQGREIRLPEAAIPPTPAGFTPIMATPHSHLGYPPIITHTAATPQGSPHATLESGGRGDLNNRLTPAMALYCTAPEQCDRPQGVLRSASIRSNSTSLSSRSSRTSSHREPRVNLRRESLSPHDLPGRRDSLSASHGHRERRSSGCGSPLAWRRNTGSQRRRRGYSSSGASFRRAQLDRENLVNQDSGSEADGEEETALNNNITLTNNLNNHQTTLLSTDHSQCNGSMSSHGQLGPRRSILTQQNSIGSPRTLSPQNSIRSRGSSPRSRQPSVHGQTSVCGSIKELEYKQNNLSLAKEAAAVAEEEEEEAGSEADAEVIAKICFLFEPRGCCKVRHDFSLYIFSPENA